jgi:uncharacterized repeat protein (TIGR01451 family)
MIRFSKLAAALAVLPIVAVTSPVFAGSPGQLAQGSGLYQVKNLTQNGSYASTISATCNDEVQYSMELANTGFGSLNNVVLTATLPSNGGTSTATATTDLGGNSGTHDSVTVNLGSGQTIALENGTTTLFDGSGHALKTLPGTITSGVNIGTLNGSTTEFVNFKAKVNCPAPPVTPPTTPTPPQVLAKTTSLPNTGPGDVAELFVGASGLGAAGHFIVNRRRR